MKTFKKVISVLMAIMMITVCCLCVPISADEGENIKFAVATDIHAKQDGSECSLPVNFPENELYFHAENSGNLYYEAFSLLKNFFKQSIGNGAQFILITGDMANSGEESQHRYFASVLKEMEELYDVPVYVVPGNHDYFRSQPEFFKECYADFGYSEALTVDDKTASYTAELPGNLRLIAIDSNDPGNNGDGFNDDLINWIDTQAKQAQADGKTVISMMHHPLLEPIPLAELIMGDFIVENHEDLAEKFTQWGIQYVFTGHEHGNSIGSYVGSNGKTVYDVLTTSLTSYPLEYRMIDFGNDSVDVKCEQITECDFDNLVEGYNEAQLSLMKSDYIEYSKGYFKYSIEKKISKYTSTDFIADKLNVSSGPLYEALDLVMPLVDEALSMPLYSKDTDGLSVEALAKSTSATLPASDYYNLYDLATSVVCEIYHGDENMPFDSSPEGKILVVGLNTMLKYILAQAGNNAATLALNTVISSFGLDKIDRVGLFRWNKALILGADNLYEISYSVLGPLLEKFLVDQDIDDRDVTLPGPGETRETESQFNTILDIIKKVIDYLINIFKTVMFGPVLRLINK